MSRPGICLVVDDDLIVAATVQQVLENAGWQVFIARDGLDAMEMLNEIEPNCILADIMMPRMDGIELCRKVRELEKFSRVPIIMLSGKPYEFDRNRAYAQGANGYITKPVEPDTFAEIIRKIVADEVSLEFWGVRGTLPVPGAHSVRYGGNTSCVRMRFSRGRSFIFDAGTGIKALSDHLLETVGGKACSTLFISHSHWDHINALPFFAPLYIQGNEFEICGPAQGKLSVYDIVSAQMSDVFFPITIKEFAASIRYRDLRQDSYVIDGIDIETMMLNHPGYCLGYRVNYNNKSICYVTDNEIYPPGHAHRNEAYLEKLTEFISGADVLITDCTYFDDEYPKKSGWGHSATSEVAQLAHNGGVGELFLFHHDPDQSDDDIDRKNEIVNDRLSSLGSTTGCISPAEKEIYNI